jgi:adenylate cyclase
VKTRLALFVMDHFPWFYLGALVLVAAVASHWSITLALLLVVATVFGLERFLHNANFMTPWLREQDDQLMFHACGVSWLSPTRRMYGWLPSDPRCRVCRVPFGGVGKMLGIVPSQKNPEFCTDCIESAPIGSHEREVGILFADIRGFTAWSERRPPAQVADLLTRFYALASRVLTRDDALVELVGDQVMALYLPDFPSLRSRTSEVMIAAAERLLAEIDRQPPEETLPVGVGLHFGVAAVGNVGKGKTKDFTAVGDAVNTAARLQSSAAAGQIVVSDEIYARAQVRCARAAAVSLSLKGKAEPFRAYVLQAGRGATAL